MKYTVMLLVITMTGRFWTSAETERHYCETSNECDKTKTCCMNECVYRQYCDDYRGYCRDVRDCGPNYVCRNNECKSKDTEKSCSNCDKYDDHTCVDGECVPKTESSFSTRYLIIIIVVAVLLVSLKLMVCSCRKRRQGQQAGIPSRSTLVLPGPPPYHSLQRLDEIEEPPPPTYEEAVRNTPHHLGAV